MRGSHIRRLWSVLFIVSSVVGTGCGTGTDNSRNDLARLTSWMTGSFSSQAQSEADSTYFDIRLHMTPVWTDRTDGHWFYVEQATASALDKPYRQRIYQVREIDDTTFASEVYTIPEPLRFVGAWHDTSLLSELTPDSLEERTGCAIFLHPSGDSVFTGSTRNRDCPSSLAGASYATSEVRIYQNELYSWDRGFDVDGMQVWGAREGGYHFIKISPTR